MKALAIALIALASLTACGGTSSKAKVPDWQGWAKWEQTERGITRPAAEVIAIGKQNKLDTCDMTGAKGAFGTTGTELIEGDWFFLCGESYARDAVSGATAAPGTVRAAALDRLDALEKKYGKH